VELAVQDQDPLVVQLGAGPFVEPGRGGALVAHEPTVRGLVVSVPGGSAQGSGLLLSAVRVRAGPRFDTSCAGSCSAGTTRRARYRLNGFIPGAFLRPRLRRDYRI